MNEGGRGRSSGGVVVLCSKQFNVELIHTHRYWILVKLFKNANTHLFLGAIYFPPCTTHNAGFKELGKLLSDLHIVDLGQNLLLLGDYNARISSGNQVDEGALCGVALSAERSSVDGVMSDRGKKCIEFLDEFELLVLNGRTPSDTPGQLTFVSHLGGSTVDLALSSYSCAEIVIEAVYDMLISLGLMTTANGQRRKCGRLLEIAGAMVFMKIALTLLLAPEESIKR